MFQTQVPDILKVSRQATRAVLSRALSAPVLVYERRGVYHEQRVSAKHHVLGKRTERRSEAWPRQRRSVVTVSKTNIVIAWYIVHRDRRRRGEDRAETPDVFLVSAGRRWGRFKVEKGQEGLEGASTASTRTP